MQAKDSPEPVTDSPVEQTAPAPDPRPRRAAMIGGIVLALVVLDQATKLLAIEYLRGQPAIDYLNGFFRFIYAENEGAFLSLGANLSDTMRFLLLTGLNGVILLGLTLVLLFKRVLRPHLVYSLTLVLAGGAGNLIDRVFRDGRVVDFMNMGVGVGDFHVRTGIFNVADLAIVAGLVLMVAGELLRPAAGRPAA